MNLFQRIASYFQVETRSAGVQLPIELAHPNHAAGVNVNEYSVLSIPALYRGIDLVSSKIASLQFSVIKTNEDGSKEHIEPHPAIKLLNRQPNELYSSYHLKKTLVWHAMIHGNGFAWVYRDAHGKPTEMYLLNPEQCTLRYMGAGYEGKAAGWYVQTAIYLTAEDEAVATTLSAVKETLSGARALTVWIPLADVFICKGLGDGLMGYSVIDILKESFGEQIACQRWSNAYYKNGVKPSLAIELPPTLSTDDKVEALRKALDDVHGGPEKAFRVLLLRWGQKLSDKSMGFTAEQSQWVESRQLHIQIISQATGVPVHLLAGQIATSYNSIEAQGQEFLQFTLDSWLCSLEAEARMKLLTEAEKDQPICGEFDRRRLIMMDTKARIETLTQEVNNGLRSRNEGRAELGLTPIGEDGDKFLMPSNLVFVDQAANPPPPPAPMIDPMNNPQDDTDDKEPEPRMKQVKASILSRLTKRIDRSIQAQVRRNKLHQFDLLAHHEEVFVDALKDLTDDADVIADDLLSSLQEEVRSILPEQLPEVMERFKQQLEKAVE